MNTHQKISFTFDGTSLMPSTGTHFLHLWHLPSMTCAFSCFPGFGRVTVRNAVGGENGRPVDGEMPGDGQLDNVETEDREWCIPWAYCI